MRRRRGACSVRLLSGRPSWAAPGRRRAAAGTGNEVENERRERQEESAASPRRFGTPPKTTPAPGRSRHMRHQRTRNAEESARGATAVTRAGAEEESQHEQNRHAGDASCGGPWVGHAVAGQTGREKTGARSVARVSEIRVERKGTLMTARGSGTSKT
ncbi:hypothetical protein ERJ75_000700500 [Trypanosoma vivax]|nr:hypothetical protein ERJ75_000700500 [Trypanosoma vivax]